MGQPSQEGHLEDGLATYLRIEEREPEAGGANENGSGRSLSNRVRRSKTAYT
jgi:hypothetical protein